MTKIDTTKYPKDLGFHFPAEWEEHEATWLSWPHKEESWPDRIHLIYPAYAQFIAELSKSEIVRINVVDEEMMRFADAHIKKTDAYLDQIEYFIHPTNDAWCRDHGPAFLVNRATKEKVVVDWDFNAWGGKYPPYDLDDVIPTKVAEKLNLPVFYPQIIMEGGAVDFNGAGAVLTSKSCLLNPNRNPHLNQEQIEEYLRNYYGVSQVLWVDDGIVGDDTDGHIDDTIRFVNEDTVLCVVEEDKEDDNYAVLQNNLKQLYEMKLEDGRLLNVVQLPMPDAVYCEGERLPASYANFYIANKSVIVPTYRCDKDAIALEIIQKCFPDRKVVGIDSTEIIWGLGSFHCLSQQEPKI
ncbi:MULTISPECIES: agmatine/peptidylarginine deiminase [Weeksella]|uniref:Agmatine deiminase n=1 Tax=Weeksella virosa (strain ATCC 43766 / DSM 16922 / JCM 21250 / CCUG 30538 / CDC 9751 / IAM 14551 / NBRC 16016 / NCTC 11634 / CL345/78) TaxID=865938 RepID=F0P0B5_WEEVC|nr:MULTISPECIES: agmatine deiminase family protein [Weeksella]ADX68475.1 Agmatine deiminase [Weeksella virosa DSM 16922]MDK7375463.1 agmatine deiminase family protein [Weeksella virosa]MDK7675354.1 agmatine deiminase family protein [Weeksella virosa]OFM84520.1 agmatine deiminase [Weeksella sp. HMSC059D05]SUP54809.1 Putative agmatine deiminase [Weeksella virosa]